MLNKLLKSLKHFFKINHKQEPEKQQDFMSKVLDKSFDDDICAQDIMFSRADLKFIRLSDTLEEVLEVFSTYNDNCIPVVDNHDIIGALTYNEIMKCVKSTDNHDQNHWMSYMKKVPFLAENSGIKDVLLLLYSWPLIVVVDEFGNSVGVITKQIFADTTIEKVYLAHQSNNKEMILSGDTNPDELNNIIDLTQYNCYNFETLNALIISLFERIPFTGEKIFIGEYEFEILEADRKYVKNVKIIKKQYQLQK